MDESAFDIDTADVTSASRAFPADRRAARPRESVVLTDLSESTDFGRRAWDEGGR